MIDLWGNEQDDEPDQLVDAEQADLFDAKAFERRCPVCSRGAGSCPCKRRGYSVDSMF